MNSNSIFIQTLRDIAPYLHYYKNKVILLYLDSRIILEPEYNILLKDIGVLCAVGVNIIVVPGTRYNIDKILGKKSISWQNQRNTDQNLISEIRTISFNIYAKLAEIVFNNTKNIKILTTGNFINVGPSATDTAQNSLVGKIYSISKQNFSNDIENGSLIIVPHILNSSSGKEYNIRSLELILEIEKSICIEKTIIYHFENLQGYNQKHHELINMNHKINLDGHILKSIFPPLSK